VWRYWSIVCSILWWCGRAVISLDSRDCISCNYNCSYVCSIISIFQRIIFDATLLSLVFSDNFNHCKYRLWFYELVSAHVEIRARIRKLWEMVQLSWYFTNGDSGGWRNYVGVRLHGQCRVILRVYLPRRSVRNVSILGRWECIRRLGEHLLGFPGSLPRYVLWVHYSRPNWQRPRRSTYNGARCCTHSRMSNWNRHP